MMVLPMLLATAATASDAAVLAQSSFWLPVPRSTTAPIVDNVFYFLLGLSTFFFTLIVVLMTLFVVRYRRRPGQENQLGSGPSHSTVLEITWSVIPLILVIIVFYWGFVGYMQLRSSPQVAYDVRVLGRQWSWKFQYPNGWTDDNLHVPVDEVVRLTLTSDDVIHSVFIPQFRVKMDAVPGRYTTAWFRATEPGEYDLFCAEYCGEKHSDMLAKVVVHKPGEFDAWLKEAANYTKGLPPAEAGKLVFERRGCGQCHTTDGTTRIGPTFKGIFGETHKFTDGSSAVVDDNYIRQSILEPQVKIREGFTTTAMSTYKGILTDAEITAMIEYIKSLK